MQTFRRCQVMRASVDSTELMNASWATRVLAQLATDSWRRSCLGLALLLNCACAIAQPGGWRVYTHSLGDQAFKDGNVLVAREHAGKRAFYLALTQALMAELREDTLIQEVPLARGLILVQQGPQVALFNLNRTPERESAMKWVGPISRDRDVLYERADQPTRIKSLDDARNLSVCVLRGNVHDNILSKKGFTRLTRHSSYEGCLRMLALGRVQLVATAEDGHVQKVRHAQLDPAGFRNTRVQIAETVGYIALSPETAIAEVQRWQAALDRLNRDGTAGQLLQRFVQQP